MIFKTLPLLAVVAAVSLAAAPATAQGQQQDQQYQGQQYQGQQNQGQQYQGQQYQGQTQQTLDQEFAALHGALRITPQQEAAWAAYRAAAPSPAVTEQRREAAAQMFPTLTAPRRIDLVEAEMRQELTEMQRQSAALKALYAALSPEQQRVFDERTLPPEQRH